MFTADAVESHVCRRLQALIAHEKARCGCAMQAVKRVAAKVGASEHWVRRITGRYGKVKIQLHQGLNVFREHIRMKRQQRAARAKTGRFWPKRRVTISHPENSATA